MKWVIHEAVTLLPEWEDFKTSLSKYGHSYQVYRQGEAIPDGDIVRCPVYDAIKYNDHPGVFCDLAELNAWCSYDKLNKYLNRIWIGVRMGVLKNYSDWLIKTFFTSDRCFIKPSPFGKIGGAHVLEPKEIDYYANKYKITDDTMMVLAEDIDINIEYRAVIINGKAVAASQYKFLKTMNEKALSPIAEKYVLDYTNKVLENVNLDSKNFVLDVGLDKNGKEFVIEMNSFSSSGFYKCNLDKIIGAFNDKPL